MLPRVLTRHNSLRRVPYVHRNAIQRNVLTSSVFVGEIGEPPYIPKADGVTDTREDKLQLASPSGSTWDKHSR